MINGKLLYPVGSIYMSINSKNPSELFGGTWERIAKGKTLVGVDESDTDFNTSQKTGGEKTHTLTINEMPSHNHAPTNQWFVSYGTGAGWADFGGGSMAKLGLMGNTANRGGSQAHNNMQPFFTCYIFVRTA